MKFPFPKWLPKIPVRVYWEGTDSDGEYRNFLLYDGTAFFDEKTKQVMDAERRLVMIAGLLIIEGDIAPDSDMWPEDGGMDEDREIDPDRWFLPDGPSYEILQQFLGPRMIDDGKIEGYVMVNGQRKAIFRAHRVRNPDGTVYSTELMLA